MLLGLYPRSFRIEHASDVLQLIEDRWEEAKGSGARIAVAFWARQVGTVARGAMIERFHPSDRRGHSWLKRPVGNRRPALRDGGSRSFVDGLRQDIRFAIRSFRRQPGFTATAVATLSLGIGANTAIFGVVNAVLVRPLPFMEPSRLVTITEENPEQPTESGFASGGVLLDWRERNRTFSDLTAWGRDNLIVETETDAVVLDAGLVYPNFFTVLGLVPMFGRGFVMDDAVEGKMGAFAIISHALWRDRWGADPGVVGSTVRIGGTPIEIVGVMPPDVVAPEPDIDLWVPVRFNAPQPWSRYHRWLTVIGRMSPEASLSAARDDMARISTDLEAGPFADVYRGYRAEVTPLQDVVVGGVRATLWVAFAAVGLVLLIACVNIANMLLARASAREREIAVRAALGAGRGRIVRQMLTESVLLAAVAGVVGVGFAHLTHGLLLASEPGILPRFTDLGLDGSAVGFALGASVVTGLLFGLVPALHGTRADVASSLTHAGGRTATAGAGQRSARAVLIAGQLAVTTVLLCGAGLLIRTMLELKQVDPGFEVTESVAARVFLDEGKYRGDEVVAQYYRETIARLTALPVVEAVGGSSALPMDPLGINYDLPYRLVGQENLPYEELPSADFRVVTPDYFRSLRIPLSRGRVFSDADRSDTPYVVVINEAMAQLVWPDRTPIGERIETPSTDWHWFEVVGVVGDTRYYGLSAEPRPEIYVAHAQVPRTEMTLVVRTAGDPAAIVNTIRATILAQDPAQPSHSVVTTASLVADTLGAQRFYTLVLGVFAAIALALSGTGVYGVLSYWVNQRTTELGVRMALGASRWSITTLVVGHGMMVAGVGIVVGLAGAVASTRVLSTVLYGVGATDPVTFLGVALVLASIAVAACWIPAARAGRVDPTVSLREG